MTVMISQLAKDVGESILHNTKYRNSAQEQRKTTGNLIQDSRLYDRDFNRELSTVRLLHMWFRSAFSLNVLLDTLYTTEVSKYRIVSRSPAHSVRGLYGGMHETFVPGVPEEFPLSLFDG
jgi:hypothetical protein